MKKLLTYCNCFTYITTGIVLVCAADFWLLNNGEVPGNALWHILLSALVTTVITVLIAPWDSGKTKEFVIRTAIHYICLCIVMTVFARWFGWVDLDAEGIITMAVSVAVVYAFTFFLSYIAGIKQTSEINRALERKRSGKQ